jgi:hypothetical protein
MKLDELTFRSTTMSADEFVRELRGGIVYLADREEPHAPTWNLQKQSRLIQSMLMRVPLPPFFVVEDAHGNRSVVDGRQRLLTLRAFLDDKLVLDLPKNPELHGKCFTNFHWRFQDRVCDTRCHVHVLDYTTDPEARNEFVRMLANDWKEPV